MFKSKYLYNNFTFKIWKKSFYPSRLLTIIYQTLYLGTTFAKTIFGQNLGIDVKNIWVIDPQKIFWDKLLGKIFK